MKRKLQEGKKIGELVIADFRLSTEIFKYKIAQHRYPNWKLAITKSAIPFFLLDFLSGGEFAHEVAGFIDHVG